MTKTRDKKSSKKPSDKLGSVTPHVVVRGAENAIGFYGQVFGAKEITKIWSPDGGAVVFAKLRIGDSIITLSDEMAGNLLFSPTAAQGGGISLHLYVDDVDSVWQTAIECGASVAASLANVYWGDRVGALIDPFGLRWTVASRIEHLSDQEIRDRASSVFSPELTRPLDADGEDVPAQHEDGTEANSHQDEQLIADDVSHDGCTNAA